jgi:hypothetical protein
MMFTYTVQVSSKGAKGQDPLARFERDRLMRYSKLTSAESRILFGNVIREAEGGIKAAPTRGPGSGV